MNPAGHQTLAHFISLLEVELAVIYTENHD